MDSIGSVMERTHREPVVDEERPRLLRKNTDPDAALVKQSEEAIEEMQTEELTVAAGDNRVVIVILKQLRSWEKIAKLRARFSFFRNPAKGSKARRR